MLNKKTLVIIVVAVSLIIASSGYFYYNELKKSIHADKEIDLAAIAQLKIYQFEQWMSEKTADIIVFSSYSSFSNIIEHSIDNSNDNTSKAYINERINICKNEYNYKSVFIVSKENEILFSTANDIHPINSFVFNKIVESSKEKETIHSDFYFDDNERTINYDVASPIFNLNDELVAYIVFRIDPANYLYPFIQSWPTPSSTSETLLIRKEGNNVLFLNELRHKKGTALKLTIPLSQKTLPAVMAADGITGIVEGTDYRGSDVIAYVTPVPGTDWFMVTKIDKKELLRELFSRGLFILLSTVFVIIAVAFGLGLFYNFKLKKQAEENDRLKTAFLANMSHEIRTPLNGILGFSSMIADDELKKEERKQYHEIIENSGQRLLSIVNDILDISMIQSNQIKIKKHEFVLADFLKEIHTLYQTLNKDKIQNLNFTIEDGSIKPDLKIYTDKDRLFQVYKNLLDNAFKFTDSGFIHFGAQQSDDFITGFVKDSGKGVPLDKVDLIFEKFNQVYNEQSIKEEGTGLGLPIAKGLIERLGGKIWIETDPGNGTAFFFKLPLN